MLPWCPNQPRPPAGGVEWEQRLKNGDRSKTASSKKCWPLWTERERKIHLAKTSLIPSCPRCPWELACFSFPAHLWRNSALEEGRPIQHCVNFIWNSSQFSPAHIFNMLRLVPKVMEMPLWLCEGGYCWQLIWHRPSLSSLLNGPWLGQEYSATLCILGPSDRWTPPLLQSCSNSNPTFLPRIGWNVDMWPNQGQGHSRRLFLGLYEQCLCTLLGKSLKVAVFSVEQEQRDDRKEMKLGLWAETERTWVLEDTVGLLDQLLLQPTCLHPSGDTSLDMVWQISLYEIWANSSYFMLNSLGVMENCELAFFLSLCCHYDHHHHLFCLSSFSKNTQNHVWKLPDTHHYGDYEGRPPKRSDSLMIKNEWNFEDTMVFLKNE